MKLVHPSWNFQIQFIENSIAQLIIEEPEYLQKCIGGLSRQFENGEGEFVLSENNVPLNLSKKADLIINPFDIQVNNRRVLTGLYDKISGLVNEGEQYIAFCEICSSIMNFLQTVEDELCYNINWNEQFDMKHLLKAFEVEICTEYCSFEESILHYIEIMREFCGIECFIFINLKDYLSKEKMEILGGELHYKKVAILLIGSSLKYELKDEKTWIIDKDLCEIY